MIAAMTSVNFVFFHIGDISQPQMLVKSIKKFNSDSKIYYVTNKDTHDIQGVTQTLRLDLDENNLMTSRLKGFSSLKLNEPAVYIDTDVLVVRPIPISLFEKYDIFLCHRTFYKDDQFNCSFREMNLSEYEGKTFGEVYPFVACFTYTKNYEFWEECFKTLLSLDKKFHYWYGDQEALKIIYEKNIFKIGLIDEKIACSLPEYSKPGDDSYSIHFKGLKRKKMMLKAAEFVLSDRYQRG